MTGKVTIYCTSYLAVLMNVLICFESIKLIHGNKTSRFIQEEIVYALEIKRQRDFHDGAEAWDVLIH